jgi:hypothetical protein
MSAAETQWLDILKKTVDNEEIQRLAHSTSISDLNSFEENSSKIFLRL